MAMRFSWCFSLCGRDKQFNSSSEMNWSQMKWTQKKTQTDAKKDEAEEVGASNCNRNAKSLLAFLLTTKTMQNAKQYCCSVVCAEMCYAFHLVCSKRKKKSSTNILNLFCFFSLLYAMIDGEWAFDCTSFHVVFRFCFFGICLCVCMCVLYRPVGHEPPLHIHSAQINRQININEQKKARKLVSNIN